MQYTRTTAFAGGGGSIPKKHAIVPTVVSLMVLTLTTSAVPTFAQETDYEYIPLDNITAEITNAEFERGIFVDKWVFETRVTNTGQENMFADLWQLETDYDFYENECPTESITTIRPGQTKTLHGCYIIEHEDQPISLTIGGHLRTDTYDVIRVAILPFTFDGCDFLLDIFNINCLPRQNIDSVTQDLSIELQCVNSESVATDNIPSVTTAIYHTGMNDIIVSFDEHVELIEGWRDHVTILAKTEDGLISQDSLHNLTNNIMPTGNMMWLTLSYSDYRDIRNGVGA